MWVVLVVFDPPFVKLSFGHRLLCLAARPHGHKANHHTWAGSRRSKNFRNPDSCQVRLILWYNCASVISRHGAPAASADCRYYCIRAA